VYQVESGRRKKKRPTPIFGTSPKGQKKKAREGTSDEKTFKCCNEMGVSFLAQEGTFKIPPKWRGGKRISWETE